jgi:hypothetical protein
MRPPLTQSDLRALDARTKGNTDARALLWEVYRLRAMLSRCETALTLPAYHEMTRAFRAALLEELQREFDAG